MEPSQQQPAPNPYGFITNPEQPKKPSVIGGASTKSRILIVLAGIVLLLIIASIGGALLSSAGQAETKSLKSIAAQQQEIIRITDIGAQKAQSSEARSLALTTKYSLMTDQQKLTAYLGGKNAELTDEEIAAKQQGGVDKELESAANNNRFDEAFVKILNAELTDYSKRMQSAYTAAKSEKIKLILSTSYTNSMTLLGQK